MGVMSILRVAAVLVLCASTMFIFMAFTLSTSAAGEYDADGEPTPGAGAAIENAQPGPPVPRRHRPWRSPAPVVKPGGRPTFLDWLGDEFNLRQCQCRKDWKSQPDGAPLCKCGALCPPLVTPQFLTEGAGQALCSLEEHTGFNCYADCPAPPPPGDAAAEREFKAAASGPGLGVKWYAQPCGGDKQPTCEKPILSYRREARAETKRRAEADKAKAEAAAAAAAGPGLPLVTWDANEVYDLRGLGCEQMADGTERCYMEDEQGREMCPPHVTHEFLGFPPDQYLCSAAMVDKYFCTASCSSDGNEVHWGAHEVAWCYDPKNKGSCPPRPTPIPKAEFQLKKWSAIPEVEEDCEKRWKDGERPPRIPNLTIGLLTHEANAFAVSMRTYEEQGLFDVVSEFLIFMNKRRPEMEEVARTYADKHPGLIRVMGDAANYGILRPMVWLTGNATGEYFMFLERDFQLIEPATCVSDQFLTGMKMIKDKTAHVVRYRHRRHPGRPNWAARMFMGHEEDVFKNGQPNLFCNHYYWIAEPDKIWPDKMWVCNKDPIMYCSDSFYCNWTNNPQLWLVSWWNKEYVERFEHFTRNDPWYDIEVYMNWEPNSWNDRKWVVAQGMGLFKHSDRAKWG